MPTSLDHERILLSEIHARAKRRRLDCGLPPLPVPAVRDPPPAATRSSPPADSSLRPEKRRKVEAYGPAYVPAEETLRTDFAQAYVTSGRRPQNFLNGAESETRFEEYPKLKRLLDLHSKLVQDHAIPPTYLEADLRTFDLTSLLPTRFDSIIVDPPPNMSWENLALLPIPSIAANPSFIWLWCGSGRDDGLEKGRALLAKWGYRRCEDFVWLKTNKRHPDGDRPGSDLFVQTKEHCLQGIRGTVRRSTDADFVHCNVDIDVLAWEGHPEDPRTKPPELMAIVENFCLGNRRLHLFGSKKSLRRGWLTVGEDLSSAATPNLTAYDKDNYDAAFSQREGQLVPNTPEVDALRPKSPPPRGGQSSSGGGIGRGRGAGGGYTHGNAPMSAPVPHRPRLGRAPMMPPGPMGFPQMPMVPGFMPPMMNPMMFGAMNPMMTMNTGAGMDWTSFFQSQDPNQRQ